MRNRDRVTPLSGLLGGETDQGRFGGKRARHGRPLCVSSVPRLGVEGGTPSGGAFDLAGRAERLGAVSGDGRAHTPIPSPADPLLGGQGDDSEGGSPLPCLSSNNSTGSAPKARGEGLSPLSPQKRKSACALAWNVQHMAEKWGLENLGFLTLTFADFVLDPKEAQRRFNSLATHVLRDRYRAFVRVFERCKSGRIHYHLLVVLDADIRTGFDFAAIKANDYRSAGKFLRDEWAFWRRTARLYRFGRTELLPVRSSSEAVARYVGKYISKNHEQRSARDANVRLVEYSRGARMAVTRFAWNTDGAAEWRGKLQTFADIVSERFGVEIMSISDFSAVLGKRWAHKHREFIYGLPSRPAAWALRRLPDGTLWKPSTGEVFG